MSGPGVQVSGAGSNPSQRGFAAALLDPACDAPPGLVVPAGADPARRFAVHRNNLMAASIDSLAAAFPVVRALVGETFFRAMARERVRTEPPRSPVLADYGAGFADFVAAFAPARGVPYLADIARLERLRTVAWHARDATPLAAATWSGLAAEPARLVAMRVVLHPACGWLHSRYAVLSIWGAHMEADDMGMADLRAIDIERPESVLVARPRFDVHAAPLPAGGADMLDALRAGATVGEAMRRAGAVDGARLEGLFALLVEHGLATDPPHDSDPHPVTEN